MGLNQGGLICWAPLNSEGPSSQKRARGMDRAHPAPAPALTRLLPPSLDLAQNDFILPVAFAYVQGGVFGLSGRDFSPLAVLPGAFQSPSSPGWLSSKDSESGSERSELPGRGSLAEACLEALGAPWESAGGLGGSRVHVPCSRLACLFLPERGGLNVARLAGSQLLCSNQLCTEPMGTGLKSQNVKQILLSPCKTC